MGSAGSLALSQRACKTGGFVKLASLRGLLRLRAEAVSVKLKQG